MKSPRQIKQHAKKIRITPDAVLDERVLALAETALANSTEDQAAVLPRRPSTRRTIMKSPITKFAAAAVIIIAVSAAVHQLGVSIESPVFAQIANKLRSATTLTYTATTSSEVEIEMAWKEPGYMRTSMPGGYVTIADWTQGRLISIMPSRRQFIEMELSSLADHPARQQFEAIEKLRSLPDQADEELGTKQEKGQVLQGFRVGQNGTINTVWIDVNTKDLVRVEAEFANAPSMNAVMSDFQFNVDLDDSLFSLTPPAGYTRMNIQFDASGVTEQDLIEYLRLWTTWTKDRSFPPTFNPVELQKVSMEMEKQGKFGDGQTSEQERLQHGMQMARGIMFVTQLPADSNWRYTGENVYFGDGGTPIFWYRLEGSETYRVIYGDLSVKDVAPENLPK